MMRWTRADSLPMAKHSCPYCLGMGLRPGTDREWASPCGCVLRAIFRVCYRHFKQCAAQEQSTGRVSLEANPGRLRKSTWSLKKAEYLADFCLIAQRTLTPEQHQIFRFHFLLGADWKLCTKRLNATRGEFFHEVYRIQEALGRAFRETAPHALFPLDEYFGKLPGAQRSRTTRSTPTVDGDTAAVVAFLAKDPPAQCPNPVCKKKLTAGRSYCSPRCVRAMNPPLASRIVKRSLTRHAPSLGMTRETRIATGLPTGAQPADA